MSQNYWPDLAYDFEQALRYDDQYDVIIIAGKDPNDTELRAHSQILRVRCPYFKTAFSFNWKEKNNDGCYIFRKPNISAKVMEHILRFLYTGIMNYGQFDQNTLISILIAADELGLLKLIRYIEKYLFKNPNIVKVDPISTLEVTHHIESLNGLTNLCLETICHNPHILLFSDKLPMMEKSLITLILERGGLRMKEVDIWDLLIRWAFAYYLTSDRKFNDCSAEELQEKAKEAIKEHIPLIGFYDMSKAEFFAKVYPHRKLLPEELLKSVLKFHQNLKPVQLTVLKCPRSCIIDSVLVSRVVFQLLTQWISPEDAVPKQYVAYKFVLLLRGSRDGFDAKTFHRLCDLKGATVLLAKIKDSEFVVGGYNPLNWSSLNTYARTDQSFIFSLDLSKLSPVKVGRVNSSHSQYAICHSSNRGPTFGGGHDLFSPGGKHWLSRNNGTYYDKIHIPENFTIEEYEIFQVVRLPKTRRNNYNVIRALFSLPNPRWRLYY